SYTLNDSAMGYTFRNEPLIASFPYLQDFESGDGYWYGDGLRSSWAYGTPATSRVRKAASGSKAWKTNLSGYYNDYEQSYLYSPCFDISNLAKPMLSFSAALEIEDCGSYLCDGGWVEYSADGGPWTKLGAYREGTNWYSSAEHGLWNSQTDARWKVASIPLPASARTMRLRFAMVSDPGLGLNGIAIDDIHIFDLVHPLYTGAAVGPIKQGVGAGGNTSFTSDGAVLA